MSRMRELSSSSSPLQWRLDTAFGVRVATIRDEHLSVRSVWGGEGDVVVIAANRSGDDHETLYLSLTLKLL